MVAVEVSDKPGGLSRVLHASTVAGVNVEYMYAFVGQAGRCEVVILRVDDPDKALSSVSGDIGRVIPKSELYQH